MPGRKNSRWKSAELDEAIAQEILELIAEGWPMTKICKRDDMPSYNIVLKWLSNGSNPEFEVAYEHAREHQADTLTDQIMEDAEHAEDSIKGDRADNARVQAVRLRIETKKWVASKMKPRKYGDKTALTGADGGAIEIAVVNYGAEKKDNSTV